MRTRPYYLLLGLLLIGCSSIGISTQIEDKGVSYYLPKTILTVEVRRIHDLENDRVWYEFGDKDGKIAAQVAPDINHRYVLRYHPSALHDDRLCITRTKTGLLNDIQFASDDRTPEVIFNVTRFIAGLVGTPTLAPVTATTESVEGKIVVTRHTAEIDPFNPADVAAFNYTMRRKFGTNSVRIDVTAMRRMLGIFKAPRYEQACQEPYVCYRTMVKVPIYLYQNKVPIGAIYAQVANERDLGYIDVTRAFLVHKITKLRFDEGVLTAAIVRKPSEVEEVSLLPLTVANAILSVPAGLFARAFSGGREREALITELANLNRAVGELKGKQDLVLQGSGPEQAADKTNYALNCEAGARDGSFVDVVTNTAL